MTTQQRFKIQKNIGSLIRIEYKDYSRIEELFVKIQDITKNGTASKWYIVPEDGKVAVIKNGKIKFESAHKYNYIGLIDCSKVKHIEWIEENEPVYS